MSFSGNGELIPLGGGDVIPLIRENLTLGRRESCDIRLPFPNVSATHCELSYQDGYWIIRDLGSTNGVKVNGVRVRKKVIHPGDTITIAKRKFTVNYEQVIGKVSMEEILEDVEDVMAQPLLEKAGLVRPPRQDKNPKGKPKGWVDDEGQGDKVKK